MGLDHLECLEPHTNSPYLRAWHGPQYATDGQTLRFFCELDVACAAQANHRLDWYYQNDRNKGFRSGMWGTLLKTLSNGTGDPQELIIKDFDESKQGSYTCNTFGPKTHQQAL